MDHMFNEFYTPEIAQWLADNADIDGRPPTALSLAQPTSHHPSSLQPRTQESTFRAPRRLDTGSHTARFHPYAMATRRGPPPHSNPTASWADNQREFGHSVPRAVRSQLRPIMQTPPSTVYPSSTPTSSLTSHLYQSGSASTNRASSSTAGLTSLVPPTVHLHTAYPQPSWAPLGQTSSQHNVWHSSSTSGTASSAIHSSGSGQSSASSSRSSSRPRLNPSPIPALHDGQNVGHLPPIFAPRPTQAQVSTFSGVFAESDRSDSSEAGPSSEPLRNNPGESNTIAAGDPSSISGSSSDVQGTSIAEVAEPSDVEEDIGVSTEQAWFSPEEFAENHTWNIHCRLARHSRTRGLFDKTGTALDPAFNQNVECGAIFDDPAAFVQHLELQHRVTNAKHGQNGHSKCAWAGCNREMSVGSYHRHVAEKHAMHWRCPYKECTGRHIRKGVNRTIGGYVQSYARINLLENHIRSHHSSDDLVTMKAAYGDGWKLAYAVLTPQIGGVTGTA